MPYSDLRLYLSLGLLGLLLNFRLALAAPARAERVASGTVGSDEILFELLTPRGELSRLVAVSKFSDDPRYSHLISIPATIKGRVGNHVESLLALRPDLAILAAYSKDELRRQLEAAGVRTVSLNDFKNLDDIAGNITKLGAWLAIESDAARLRSRFQEQRQAVKKRLQVCAKGREPRIIQFAESGILPGRDTIFNAVAAEAGFQNEAARLGLQGWVHMNQEVLATLDPEWIVMAGDSASKAIDGLRQRPAWKDLGAVKAGRVIVIPDRVLYSVSHHVIELLNRLATHHACR